MTKLVMWFTCRTELIEGLLDLVVATKGKREVELVYEIAPGTPEVFLGDAARLRQILMNLLSNALKFTKQGEVVLSVSARHHNDLQEYRFAIRDTGIGISADRQLRLFRDFTQAEASTTREYGGTGLGLAICKRLVELMRGQIGVDSTPGRGSTFWFTILARSVPRQVRRESEHEALLRGARLLCVDDNATSLRVLSAKAHGWGLQVTHTCDPREAYTWVERGDPFDVILLDHDMPSMDGVELARRIRSVRPTHAPLLILASNTAWGGLPEGQFAAVLTKPVKFGLLYNSIAMALEQWRRAPNPKTLRVLLAEDNVTNQKVTQRMLEHLGYHADIVSNGREVLDALEQRRYDVVLLDVQMPEMDGLTAARAICARWPRDQRPRLVAITAHVFAEDEQRCRDAGMDDYIKKPLKLESLGSALSTVDQSRRRLSVDVPLPARPGPAKQGKTTAGVLG